MYIYPYIIQLYSTVFLPQHYYIATTLLPHTYSPSSSLVVRFYVR
nr:MAG TPA: hypothetical protein [Caudoviricetes sp.]